MRKKSRTLIIDRKTLIIGEAVTVRHGGFELQGTVLDISGKLDVAWVHVGGEQIQFYRPTYQHGSGHKRQEFWIS